jgi:hypothetical protein
MIETDRLIAPAAASPVEEVIERALRPRNVLCISQPVLFEPGMAYRLNADRLPACFSRSNVES